jgi:hypothetical protein
MKNLISKTERERIDEICKDYLEHYRINNDGSVDVDGSVNLNNRRLDFGIPLQFGKVTGDFGCNSTQISSLVGSPKWVGGNFFSYQNHLTTLEGAPIYVGGTFNCHGNRLTTMEGIPKYIGRSLSLSHNKLISTYSSNTDIDIADQCNLNHNEFPILFDTNLDHINIILKYQRHFEIWNEDLTLNDANFNELIAEINDGLL